MAMIGEVFKHYSVADDSQMIGVKFQQQAFMNDALLRDVLHLIAEKIADHYVAEHYQEVIAAVNPEAVATLVAAEAAAEIRKTLKEKIPDKIVEVVRKDVEVWQRGILGGVKRIR